MGRKETTCQDSDFILHRRMDTRANCQKIGVSRPIVSKMIQKAKEAGIIEIYIKDESIHTVELEQKLEKYFNLKDAVVVPSVGLTPDLVKSAVGRAGAYYLSKNLKT